MELQEDHFAKLLLAYPDGTTLINTDDKHYKFWNIKADGSTVVTTWGRIGYKTQSSTKQVWSPEKEMQNLIWKKLQKGYKKI